MSEITASDITLLAKLANLNITKEEIELYRAQISDIVHYVDQLQQVDTSGVSPLLQTTNLVNIFHEYKDAKNKCLSSKQALSNASEVQDDQFEVEAVFGDRKH